MRVYIVRHGESVNNFQKLWTGWLDVPLTEKGVNDAEKAKSFIGGVDFDKVYSSDLIRAVETAKIALPSYSLETSPLLREVNVGSIAGSPISTVSSEKRVFAALNGYSEYGGETKEEFQSRIRKFTKELETKDFKNVAIFSHAGWLRGFLDEVVGVTLPRKNIVCANCAIGIFEFEKDVWKLHSWINID